MNKTGTALLMVVMAMSVLGLLCVSFLLVGGYMRASSTDQIEAEKQHALSKAGFDYAVAHALNYYENTHNPQNILPTVVNPWPKDDAESPYVLSYRMEQKMPGLIIVATLLKGDKTIRELHGLCAPFIMPDGSKKWRVSSAQIN